MKKLKYLILHCTDTPEGRNVTKKDIEQWHLKGRGWSRLGYSDMIDAHGNLISLTEFDQDQYVDNSEMTWGAKGINSLSRHFVYAGGKGRNGKPFDTRSQRQKEAMAIYVYFTILRHPNILIGGHNQFSSKACPSFDVPVWLESIGVNSKNIYYGKTA